MTLLRIAVTGAAGKMGRMVIDAIAERPAELVLVAAVEHAGHPAIGTLAAPGVPIGDDVAAALAAADVYVDFSSPAATAAAAEVAGARGVAGVVGTTGLDGTARAALARAAARVPIVVAPNFSVGVNLLLALAEQAARLLGPDFDLEVVETHHRQKRDAPSGTALALAEAMARGRGLALADAQRTSRSGDIGARPAGEIGVLAVRGGDVVGEHTLHFLGPAERLELTHRAGSRVIFARGALRAAAWVHGRAPGIYGMREVIGTPASP